MSGLRAISARALRVLTLVIAGVAALALGVTAGSSAEPSTTASSYAVLINIPGAQSSGTLTSPAGSYQYRDLVSIHSYTAGSAVSDPRAYGHSELSGISLLGGYVTAGSVEAKAYADGRKTPATGTFGGAVTGLVVNGAAISPQPGAQFEIPGIGWGAVNERRVVHSASAYRGSEVALHVHLTVGWHDLPAGHRDPARLCGRSGRPAEQDLGARRQVVPVDAEVDMQRDLGAAVGAVGAHDAALVDRAVADPGISNWPPGCTETAAPATTRPVTAAAEVPWPGPCGRRRTCAPSPSRRSRRRRAG